MVSEGAPALEVGRPCLPGSEFSESDRLARRDLLILRLEVARRRRRLAQQAVSRVRPTSAATAPLATAALARLSG